MVSKYCVGTWEEFMLSCTPCFSKYLSQGSHMPRKTGVFLLPCFMLFNYLWCLNPLLVGESRFCASLGPTSISTLNLQSNYSCKEKTVASKQNPSEERMKCVCGDGCIQISPTIIFLDIEIKLWNVVRTGYPIDEHLITFLKDRLYREVALARGQYSIVGSI